MMRRSPRTRVLRALTASIAFTLAFATVLSLTAVRVLANGPTVTGAGSTWVAIALDQWRADIAQQGYSINFQSVGSSAGREFFIIKQVDFAASEIPFQPDELPALIAAHRSYQYVPDVAGGTSLMYNLHTPAGTRITTLRLDALTAAKIFTGALTSWQDPEIKALNPSMQIAETHITPVIRSDGSGTSAQFSLYLANQAPAVWNAFVAAQGCPAPCSLWPPFNGSQQQNGSDGVANYVANNAVGTGAIGYVESGYALGRGFPVAYLKNHSGNFTTPTSNNVATALKHAVLYPNNTQNLIGVYNAPDPTAYPMSSYSYLITQTTGFDPAKGFVLGTWMLYIACAGQREASPLGYSPLPPNLVADLFAAVRRIPGAPTPPPLDYQHCPNPTLASSSTGGHGGGRSGSGGSHASGSGGSGTTGTKSGGTTSTPGATPGNSGAGSSGGSASPTPEVATLGAAQREASFIQAEAAALAAQPPSATPLFLCAIGILLIVTVPAVLGWRRGSRQRGGDSAV
jgi:phosphate transport system substrate-binding protein